MAEKQYTDARNIEAKLHAIAALEGVYKMWVQKFIDSGMNQIDAEKQAKAVISNIQLPLV